MTHLAFALWLVSPSLAQAQPDPFITIPDLVYGTYQEENDPPQPLRLDIYQPVNPPPGPMPVVAWIHGGAWAGGDKVPPGVAASLLTPRGYTVVSINYRLTDVAIWPAQIHDCKGAIRWLRANAAVYNLDPEHIGVWGGSAGGHLVSFLGTSGDMLTVTIDGVTVDLEGTIGGNNEFSSRVQAVGDWFGPADLLRMEDFSGLDEATRPQSTLLGASIQTIPALAATANPLTYVTADDPPFLILNGSTDTIVPFNQAEIMQRHLLGVGVPATLFPMIGFGHGGFPGASNQVAAMFFDTWLKEQAPPNLAPIPVFTASVEQGPAPLAVSFDAAGSADPDGHITVFVWGFGDSQGASGPAVDHVYTQPGRYTVSLGIRDDLGAARSLTREIEVLPGPGDGGQPPSVIVTAPVDGATLPAPAYTILKVDAQAADGGSIVQVEFFVDGEIYGVDRRPPFTSAEWMNVSPGDYVVTARATDDRGNSTMGAPVAVRVGDDPGPTDPGWVAYNDLNALAGGNDGDNITRYNYQAIEGPLRDVETGEVLPVTMTGHAVGGYDPTSNGGNFEAGTEAHTTFDGVVDAGGVYELDGANWQSIVQLDGLDPTQSYTITLTANRDNGRYAGARFTRVTLVGADTFVNASSDGVIVYGEDSVSFCTGDNRSLGYVARWTDVTADDGEFSVVSEWDHAAGAGSGNTKGYAMTVFKLEQHTTEPEICVDNSDCEDGNPCTDDACNVGTGVCTHLANQAPCDDGVACTVNDQCADGLCTHGTPTDALCNDEDVCTDDLCAPQGCDYANNQAACDDGVACTNGDQCLAGTCRGADACPAGEACDHDAGACTAQIDPNASIDFSAYNDLAWAGGQWGHNITTLTSPNGGSGFASAGEMIEHASGEGTGITLTVSGGNYNGGGHADDGGEPPVGSDAFETFDGIVTTRGAIAYLGGVDAPLVLTFSGLSPEGRYNLVFHGDRGTYGWDRAALVTLTSAVAFINQSSQSSEADENPQPGSNGALFSDPQDPSTRLPADNRAGYVARFVDIEPGDDGEIALVISADGNSGYRGKYASAVLLQKVATACAGDGECDDGNPCTDDRCDAILGCQRENNQAPCDDGIACTSGDLCGEGVCQGQDACPEGEHCDVDGDECSAVSIVEWIAYNDLNGSGSNNAAFVTHHDYQTDALALVDFETGATVPVVVTGTTVSGYDPKSNGGDCAAGTDADAIFGDVVGLAGIDELDAPSWHSAVTFDLLDPTKQYTITLAANRNNPAYAGARFSRVTIEGADTYVNESSSGVTVYSEASVAFSTGYNTANGYVARWSGITAADGRFTVVTTWDNSLGGGSANTKGYAMSAFRLEQIGGGGGGGNTVDTAQSAFGVFTVYTEDFMHFAGTMGMTIEEYRDWAGGQMNDLGAHWTRSNMQLIWDWVEPDLGGDFDWTASFDGENVFGAAARHDTHYLAVFHAGSGPDAGAHAGVDPLRNPVDDLAAYQRFVQAAVERYDGDGIDDSPDGIVIKHWQMGNEIPFWASSGRSPEDYVAWFVAAAEAARAADPDAHMVLMASTDSRVVDPLHAYAITALTDLGVRFDAIDIHHWGTAAENEILSAGAYRQLLTDAAVPEVELWSCEHSTYYGAPRMNGDPAQCDPACEAEQVCAPALARCVPRCSEDADCPAHRPRCDVSGLCGEPAQSQTEQARSLIYRFVINRALGFSRIMWNNLASWRCFAGRCGGFFDLVGLVVDGNGPGENDDALLGTPRLSYYAYQMLAERTDTLFADMLGEHDAGVPDTHVYAYQSHATGEMGYVAWADVPTEVSLPAESDSVRVLSFITDADGVPLRDDAVNASGATVAIPLDPDPVWISADNP